jgi:hypothetical protein
MLEDRDEYPLSWKDTKTYSLEILKMLGHKVAKLANIKVVYYESLESQN